MDPRKRNDAKERLVASLQPFAHHVASTLVDLAIEAVEYHVPSWQDFDERFSALEQAVLKIQQQLADVD